MNTTLASDKRVPPIFTEIKNVDISKKGRLVKRFGISNASTNASPDIPETRINAIAPWVLGDPASPTNQFIVALGDDQFYYQVFKTSSWQTAGSAQTGADTFPWRIAWGINAALAPRVYFADKNAGVFAIEAALGSLTKHGSDSDASNPWDDAEAVEYFLQRLWVANIKNGSTNLADSLYFSVAGDDNDFYSAGSGLLVIRPPGGGTSSTSVGILGLRVYRNSLYVATGVSLGRITGTTEDTFGHEFIRPQRNVTGSTMYAAGDYLFYVDFDGIWQFNGSTAINLVNDPSLPGNMQEKWDALSDANDIEVATATWDDGRKFYSVYFPAVAEQWFYHYETGQWMIWTYSAPNAIRVISPPCGAFNDGQQVDFALGAATNGHVYRLNKSVKQDDGVAIVASITTGHMPIAGYGNEARITGIAVYVARQTADSTIKLDITPDGDTHINPVQLSLTATLAGSQQDFPTKYVFDSPTDSSGNEAATGEFFQFKLTCETDNVLEDVRALEIEYEVLKGAA